MQRPWTVLASLVLAAAVAVGGGQAQAQSWWGGGVQFGWGPAHPFHHPHHPYHPPYRYAPPPAPVAGEGCYAGPYVCPLEGPARVGMPCSCPTAQGPAWGRAR